MALYTTAIQKLYVAYFSRPADAGGLEWWEGIVAGANGDTSMISAEFAKSNEYQLTFAGKNNYEIVRTVYINLFGREPEAAGVDFWSNALDKRLMTIDVVVTEIAKGAQNEDLKAFNNKVTAATAFTAALDTHPERAAYLGDEAHAATRAFLKPITTDASLAEAITPEKLAASVAAFVAASRAPISFDLTANVDAGVAFTGGGGDDTFRATAATLGAGDTLKGGGGNDTLVLDDVNGNGLAALPAGVSTSGIENFVGRSGAGVGSAGAAYDLSGQADMRTLSFDARGAVSLKIGDAASASITTTAGAVTVAGGKAIAVSGHTGVATLTGNALTKVTLANTSQDATIVNATAGHTLDLGLALVTGGATIKDAEATTVNLSTSAPEVTIPEQVPVRVKANLDMAKAAALNITTVGGLELVTTALAAADALKTITLKGSGSMQADLSGILPFNAFDASTYGGNTRLTIASATNLSVKGGSGNDHLVLTGALAGSATIQLGAGNDVFDFSRAAQQGAKVDGGVGGDDWMIVNDAALLATPGQVFTNFETLDFSSGKGEYDLDKAGSVTTLYASKQLREDVEFVNGRANSSIKLVSEPVNIDIDGKAAESLWMRGNITFGLKDASGANDVLSISLTARDGIANGLADGQVEVNTIEAKGIETINLHSAVGTVEQGRMAADYANAISYLNIDGAKTLKVTGNASLDLTAVYASTLSLFDASASGGDIDFAGVVNTADGMASRLTYLGSAGKDGVEGTDVGIVFQGNGGKDELMLSREEGVADIIRFAKASDSYFVPSSNPVDRIDTYYYFQSGVDKIDLSSLHLAAGANRAAIAVHDMYSNNWSALNDVIGNGAGFFNDGGTNRSLAFGSFGDEDGYLFVDIDGDGNFNGGVDMVFLMYGNTGAPSVADFVWG
ncbi:DUF4214 domain-containing protein [Massilia sp. MS-15]|uniref:DUF4214 domain-containing protein n=1 Tax=Massilia sp. MS-15 TaxID=2878200 RepID=UPI001CD275A6|nr:DUF4214 domain-containing protein [Massilia sp. MS-15]MCA1245230.1 DUF4214 domain-containing protein [Massilia sp. MS-15]